MIVLAALAGAAIVIGLVLCVREIRGLPASRAMPARGKLAGRMLSGGGPRILIALAVGVVIYAISRWPVAGLIAVAAVLLVPRSGTAAAQRQRTAMLEALEQWTRRLADMITASRGIEDALEASARSAPDAIAGPVSALAGRLAARTGAEAALRAFAAEIDDPAGDRIAAALIIATGRRGGGARDVLSALASLLSRDVAARREIDAERAQHRTTVRWITAFVAGFSVFAILNRSYSAPYSTVTGQFVLAAVAVVYGLALWWLHRLATMPAPGRFLDSARPDDQRGWSR
jgi:Flp pilus assembly protein TadB